LIRIVVRTLVIEEWGPERVRVRIGWTDGAPDQVVDVWLPAGIEHLVSEAHVQGKSRAEIAVTLNEMEYPHAKGSRLGGKGSPAVSVAAFTQGAAFRFFSGIGSQVRRAVAPPRGQATR
jgi:hypothetical protein